MQIESIHVSKLHSWREWSNLNSISSFSIRILAGCSFSGKIPDELGNLEQLSFLYDLL